MRETKLSISFGFTHSFSNICHIISLVFWEIFASNTWKLTLGKLCRNCRVHTLRQLLRQ